MLKQPACLVSLALLMFAANAAPLTAKAAGTQFDGPSPYPPVPPASCMLAPCQMGIVG
jgi:hypothetical protein